MLLGTTTVVGSANILGGPDKDATPERVAGLIKQLGDPKFVNREAAGRDLTAIGEPALDALREAAAAADPEVQSRAERIIAAISRRVTTRELEKLQGTWSLVSYDLNGNRIKGEDKAHLFVFRATSGRSRSTACCSRRERFNGSRSRRSATPLTC
jgi:hypothetical protein